MITALRKSRGQPVPSDGTGPATALVECKKRLDVAFETAACFAGRLCSQLAASVSNVAARHQAPEPPLLLASVSNSALEPTATLPSKDRPRRSALATPPPSAPDDAPGQREGAGLEGTADERILISEVNGMSFCCSGA